MALNASEDPKMHLIERGPDGVQLRAVEGSLVCEHAESFSASQTVFADDGQLLACLHTDEVHIYDTINNSILHRLPTPGTIAAYFSPAGSYLVIYQKANTSGAGEEKNLSVWQLDGAKKVFACFQRTFNNSNRRTLQFSDDESIASRAVTNEVHFYNTNDFLAQPFRLRVPHVSSHKISPGKLPTFVAFVPEMKGQPASVRLYGVPSGVSDGFSEAEPLAQKSFFRVNEVEYEWAADGSAVLILGSSELDATNRNYYGESSLFFMRADGTLECKVPLDKEGPVHDAAFSPKIDEFVVVYGYMPANATIFSSLKCEPIYQLGAGPHNTVRWNPFGRFLCLAGFGNLPGDMQFFDRKADGKYKVIGKARANCSVSAEWSPNGRYLLTATTAPRLNVDNGYKLWRYSGELLQHVARERLFEAKWQPVSKNDYLDRPISPGRVRRENPETGGHGHATFQSAAPYRPPHVTSGSGNFSLAKAAPDEAGPGRYRPTGASKAQLSPNSMNQGPPGAIFVNPDASKNAAKNAKKRAAARARKQNMS